LIENKSGTTEFCILLEVVKSIGTDSVTTNLLWSFISLQMCRFNIINNYCFTQFHVVELYREEQENQRTPLLKSNSAWSEQE